MKTLLHYRFFMLVTFLAFTSHAWAQTYYKKEIDFPGETYNYTSHVTTFDGATLFACGSTSASSLSYLTLLKVDVNGTLIWSKRYGPLSNDFENIVQSPDSGFFICCADVSTSTYSVIKTDQAGNVLFTEDLTVPAAYNILTAGQAMAKNDGGLYIASNLFEPSTSTYIWHLFEVSANGTLISSHCYNMNTSKSYCMDIDTCDNGDVLLMGSLTNANSEHFPLITRIAANGSIVWSKCYQSPGADVWPTAMVHTTGDYIYVISSYANPPFFMYETILMKTNGAGVRLWCRNYSENFLGLYPLEITYTTHHEIVITGESFVLKSDTSGLPVCSRMNIGAFCTSIDTIGSMFTLSGFSWFVQRPLIMTADACGYSCNDSDLVVTKANFTTFTTTYSANISLAMTTSARTLAESPVNVTLIEVCSAVQIEEPVAARVKIFPSPASGYLNVEAGYTIENALLFDAQGKCVICVSPDTPDFRLDISGLSPGIYLLRLRSGTRETTQKIIIS